MTPTRDCISCESGAKVYRSGLRPDKWIARKPNLEYLLGPDGRIEFFDSIEEALIGLGES